MTFDVHFPNALSYENARIFEVTNTVFLHSFLKKIKTTNRFWWMVIEFTFVVRTLVQLAHWKMAQLKSMGTESCGCFFLYFIEKLFWNCSVPCQDARVDVHDVLVSCLPSSHTLQKRKIFWKKSGDYTDTSGSSSSSSSSSSSDDNSWHHTVEMAVHDMKQPVQSGFAHWTPACDGVDEVRLSLFITIQVSKLIP